MRIKGSIVKGGDTWEHRIDVLRGNLADGSWDYLFLVIALTYVEADAANDMDKISISKALMRAYRKGDEKKMVQFINALDYLNKEGL